MNEEALNLSIRKFLKQVGVQSQRELEQATRKAIAEGSISGKSPVAVTMILESASLKLTTKFDGELELS
jgi:hypothetical protein